MMTTDVSMGVLSTQDSPAPRGFGHPSFLGLHFFSVPERRDPASIPKPHRNSFFTTESTENTELNIRSTHPREINDVGG